jgi:hypothetical protein
MKFGNHKGGVDFSSLGQEGFWITRVSHQTNNNTLQPMFQLKYYTNLLSWAGMVVYISVGWVSGWNPSIRILIGNCLGIKEPTRQFLLKAIPAY